MSKIFSMAGAVLLAVILAGEGGAQTAPPPPYKDYPAKPWQFPNGVTWMPDMTYSALPGFRPLKLDIYRPPSTKALPLVLYIHGGAWEGGHPRSGGTYADFPAELAKLAAKGYVVAAASYRLSGEARFPAAVQDVKTALRWLRVRASEYGIDPTRAVIWGASAGGHLAALVGTSCNDPALAPPNAPNASDCVQGVIDWYGISDVKTWATEWDKPGQTEPTRSRLASEHFMGCKIEACSADALKEASPLAHVDASDPPFLIQAGDHDTIVKVNESQDLYAALRAANIPAELVVYPGIDHSLANFPREPNPVNPEVNLKAMEKIAEFLGRTVGR